MIKIRQGYWISNTAADMPWLAYGLSLKLGTKENIFD
jgi:hypothetical protein